MARKAEPQPSGRRRWRAQAGEGGCNRRKLTREALLLEWQKLSTWGRGARATGTSPFAQCDEPFRST